jgi:hypothetical protein
VKTRAALLLLRVTRWAVQASALLSNVNSVVAQSGLIVRYSNCGNGKMGRDGAVETVHFCCFASWPMYLDQFLQLIL